jgi:hypothetical protein
VRQGILCGFLLLGGSITSGVVSDPLSFSFACDPQKNALVITTDLAGLEGRYQEQLSDGQLQISASLLSKRANRSVADARLRIGTLLMTFALPFGELDPGEYTVCVAVAVPGGDGKIAEGHKPFERPDPVFLKDRKGVRRLVPEPWTGIQAENRTVRTRFHTYRFGDGPFPREAMSQGEHVLRKEPQLTIMIQGKSTGFVAETWDRIESAGDRLVDEGQARAAGAGIGVRWRRRIDYDGLIRVDMEFRPVERTTIKSMVLEFEVAEAAADYALTLEPRSLLKPDAYAHSWKTEEDASIRSFPFAWLTNDHVGFCFFTDTDANWVREERQKPIVMMRRDGQPIIRAELISRPVTASKPFSYVLAMMATPGKKPRRDIHAEGFGVPTRQTVQSRNWFFDKDTWFENMFCLRRLWWPDKAKASIDWYAQKGIDCIPYACTNYTVTHNPIYDYYGLDWSWYEDGRPASNHTHSKWAGKEWWYAPACPACASYADYMCYYVDKYLRETDFKGIYLDAGSFKPCDSPRHGCRREDVLDPGRIPLSYNIFGVRDLYERLWKIVHTHEPKGYIFAHAWDRLAPPLTSFWDITNPGEEYMHSATEDRAFYLSSVPLEMWQSIYRPEVVGCSVQFLGMCGKGVPGILQMSVEQRMELSRNLFTCLVLHDIPCSGGWYVAVGPLWEILDRNKVAEAQFSPYWRQKTIQSSEKDVLISYYRWEGQKRCLLLMGNWGNTAREVSLSFDGTDARALRAAEAVDEETGQAVDLSCPVRVDGHDFRIIRAGLRLPLGL